MPTVPGVREARHQQADGECDGAEGGEGALGESGKVGHG